MARYIDADALFEPNESTDKVLVLGRSGGKTIALAEKMMRERVNMAPTLTLDDLRPKGRWVDGKCSRCGALIPTDNRMDFIAETDCHYCYNCGADMRGGGEDA